MKFKTFGKYIFLGMLFLVVVLSCVNMNTKAEATTGILYLEDTTIAECRKNETYTAPTKKAGYVFGGWYNDEQGLDPMTEEEANVADTAFAKWVPDYVLSVKAQVNQNALNDDFTGSNRAAIRLLTSVDSRNYAEVGFDVVRGDYPSYTYHLDSKSVFTQVRVVGEKEGAYTDHTPEGVFGSDSHFFEAVTFKNMPEAAVNTELTVTPYWITPDGTRVEGAYSIKTVNLGRSWVYIGSGETVSAEGEYGTHGHPYSSLESALDAVCLENGKITIKENDTVNVPADFKWNGKKDFGKTRNITVTGENGTDAFISFDVVPDMHFNDNVTFSNVKVHFATQVYANGYTLTIAKDALVNNTDTNLYGGALKESVDSTNLQIQAGNYVGIYGGGRDAGGNVAGDTHINVTNATVYNSTTQNSSMIIGGGRGDNTVGGSTNVTVGTGFNAGITVQEKLYSSIYGGAREGGVVAKDTNVIINDGAKVDFVFGGGAKNTQVQGTCNVTMTGGEVSTIWGGASTEGEDAGTIGNATFVKMTGGTIGQIFGGTGVGMEGDSYVSVSGGTVTRRIYGGCYHSDSDGAGYVKGTSTVVIGKDATLQFSTILGEGICAGSRFAGTQADEIGILIFEGGTYAQYSSKIAGKNAHTYDYLINATGDGNVEIEDDILDNQLCVRVEPATDTPGTIAKEGSDVSTYFKGEGVCELPTIAENETNCVLEIDFNASDVQNKLDNCEARIEGIYYSTLEDAVAFAIERQDIPFVTLMNDANIESEFTIAKGQTLKIQSEAITEAVGENEFGQMWNTISGIDSSKDLFVVNSSGELELNNLQLTGGKHSVYSQGTVDVNNLYIHDIGGVGIYLAGGANEVTNLKIENAERFGILVTNGQATADNVTINNVGTDGSSRYAIKCQTSGKLTITANNDAKNGVTITGMASGGGITNASSAKLEAVGVNIDGVTSTKYYPIYIEAEKEMEITDLNITRASGNTTELIHIASGATFTLRGNDETKSVNGNSSAGDGYIGRGVVVNGTFNLYGGNISNNKISSGNGAGVQVKAGGTFNMYGGSVSGNTAPNGGGVSLEGTAAVAATETTEAQEAVPATFNLEGGSVSENIVTAAQANNGYGAGGGVYITNGALTMSSQSTGSISDNDGHNDGAGVYLGAGATFDMYNGSVNGNELTTYSARGGGVCVNAADAVFTLHGGEVSHNIARAGGGIIIKAGECVMNGGTLSGNQAVQVGSNAGQGGAIYILNSNSIFTMNGGDITENSAKQGTAIFANNGTFNWNGGTFTGYAANSVDGTNGKPTVNIKNSVPESERVVINSVKMKVVNIVE